MSSMFESDTFAMWKASGNEESNGLFDRNHRLPNYSHVFLIVDPDPAKFLSHLCHAVIHDRRTLRMYRTAQGLRASIPERTPA